MRTPCAKRSGGQGGGEAAALDTNMDIGKKMSEQTLTNIV